MNLCGKLLNNFLHLCCCVVVFILLTRGKTVEVLHLDDSSCVPDPLSEIVQVAVRSL